MATSRHFFKIPEAKKMNRTLHFCFCILVLYFLSQAGTVVSGPITSDGPNSETQLESTAASNFSYEDIKSLASSTKSQESLYSERPETAHEAVEIEIGDGNMKLESFKLLHGF
jgi:hypothetical protein